MCDNAAIKRCPAQYWKKKNTYSETIEQELRSAVCEQRHGLAMFCSKNILNILNRFCVFVCISEFKLNSLYNLLHICLCMAFRVEYSRTLQTALAVQFWKGTQLRLIFNAAAMSIRSLDNGHFSQQDQLLFQQLLFDDFLLNLVKYTH